MKTFGLNHYMNGEKIYYDPPRDPEYSFEFSILDNFVSIGEVPMHKQHLLLTHVWRSMGEHHNDQYYLDEWDLEETLLLDKFNDELETIAKKSHKEKWDFTKQLKELHDLALKHGDDFFEVVVKESKTTEMTFITK